MLLDAYPVLLWLHIVALIAWSGLLLVSDLRRAKWISFGIAAVCGGLLFAAKPGAYSNNPGFWIKMALVGLLGVSLTLRRRVLTLVLLGGAVLVARGPATVKDIMHSMVDPSADFLFESVQIVSNETGVHEKAPRSEAEWQDVDARVRVLLEAPSLLSAPGLRAARPRDRSQSPEVENEPAEVQQLLDTQHPDFVRRAERLRAAALVVQRAVVAKDKDALLHALDGIDRACESCHVHYWYPKDARAREVARESGIEE
ncbi:MAG: hypothetical protein ABIR70_03085 [Bryobacteraceae bacterium]